MTDRKGPPPGYDTMPLTQKNAAYLARCCDWHWGDGGGCGDPSQPCETRTLNRLRPFADAPSIATLRADVRWVDKMVDLGPGVRETMLRLYAAIEELAVRRGEP